MPSALELAIDVELECRRRGLKPPTAEGVLDFTLQTYPTYQAGWFHRAVAKILDEFIADVIAKRSPRTMLFAPPRSGKTELVSRRTPAYVFGKYPDLSIIGTSYASDLASRTNRDVQRIIDDSSYSSLFPATRLNGSNIRTVAKGTWLRNSDIFEIVGRLGSYRSAGVGCGITGMGADILIIDDPFKDAAEANSATVRESVWEWYTSTAYTRLSPGGGVLIINTRWHEDDLSGRIIKKAKEDEDSSWKIYNFPAIAEADDPARKSIPRCKVDRENRKVGEALHPERYDVKQLDAIKKTIGTYYWSALYQGSPTSKGGNKIKTHWFKFIKQAPVEAKRLRWWDRAATKKRDAVKKNDPDWTAGARIAVDSNGLVYIEHIRALRGTPLENEQAIKQQAQMDGASIAIWMEQEPGSAGVDVISHYSRTVLQGFDFHGQPSTGAKENFIDILSAAAEAGNVYIVGDPTEGFPDWLTLFFEQTEAYPTGTHEDLLEAAAKAYCKLVVQPGMGMFDYFESKFKELTAKKQQKQAQMAGRA